MDDDKIKSLHSSFNESYLKLIESLVPYLPFDINLIDSYYTMYDFTSKYFDKLEYNFYPSLVPDQNAQTVLDLIRTWSPYRFLLEQEKIALGDEDRDPAMIFIRELKE